GRNWPETRLNHVVLPAPLGPTITVSSPGRNAQLTSLTAACPPKRIVRFSVRREGVDMVGNRQSSVGSKDWGNGVFKATSHCLLPTADCRPVTPGCSVQPECPFPPA